MSGPQPTSFDVHTPVEPGITLLEASAGLTHPVLIRGLMRGNQAVRHWSAEYLETRCGDVSVMAMGVPCDETARAAFRIKEEMPLRAFLKRMADERIYLSASTEMFAECPELVDELDLEQISRTLLDGGGFFDELVNTQFFIGAQHVYTSLHCAPGGNVFLQVRGRKKWTLIDPVYTAALHPLPARPFQYAMSGLGGFETRRRKGQPLGVLERLPRFEVTLEPGDVLYNTPWWWHEVQNLDPFTVGCAIRHVPQPGRAANWRNHLLMTLLSTYPKRRMQMLALVGLSRLRGRDLELLKLSNAGTSRRVHESFRAESKRKN